MHYAVIEAGLVIRHGEAPEDHIAIQAGPGQLAMPAPDEVQAGSHYWDGAEFRACPERPGPWARFDAATQAWIDPRTEADHDAERAISLATMRVDRDRRLTACDWTQVSDNAMTETQRAAWRAYRQALRDLPELTVDPGSPDWPIPPTE